MFGRRKAPTEAGALYDRETSIDRLALPRLLPLDLLDGRQHALPNSRPVQGAGARPWHSRFHEEAGFFQSRGTACAWRM